jgi:hypothetical protein
MTQPKPIPSVFLDDTNHRRVLEQRVHERIIKHGGEGCWEWQWSTQHHGHAMVARKVSGVRVNVMVHRLMYAWEYGDQPLPLDHLCGNPPCVNPRHLQPVTPRVNSLRGSGPAAENAQKDHCIQGHPLYGDNLYIQGGRRRCRECGRQRHRKWYESQERKTNARKGDRRTHCKHGHPATAENTYYRKNGAAECKVCHRERENTRRKE